MRSPSKLVQTIETIGETYPSAFAGTEKKDDCQAVVFVVRGQGPPLLGALPPIWSTTVGPSYRVRTVNNSMVALISLTYRIESDAGYLKGRGIKLESWGPDLHANKVIIYLRHYDASQARLLTGRYGSNVVAVSRTSNNVVPLRSQIADSSTSHTMNKAH